MTTETLQELVVPSKSFIKKSATDVRCPECRNLVREVIFKKEGGCVCLDCFEAGLIRRIWRALFPPPKWVVAFEKALDQDTAKRQEMYRSWIEEMTGGGAGRFS